MLPLQGTWVWFLIGELRSHMLGDMAKKCIIDTQQLYWIQVCSIIFNTCIYCEMVTTVSLVNIFHHTWKVKVLVAHSFHSLWPRGLQPASLLWPMEFSKQKYLGGLPFCSPGDLPDPWIEPRSPTLQTYSLPTENQLTSVIIHSYRLFCP